MVLLLPAAAAAAASSADVDHQRLNATNAQRRGKPGSKTEPQPGYPPQTSGQPFNPPLPKNESFLQIYRRNSTPPPSRPYRSPCRPPRPAPENRPLDTTAGRSTARPTLHPPAAPLKNCALRGVVAPRGGTPRPRLPRHPALTSRYIHSLPYKQATGAQSISISPARDPPHR